LSFRRNGGLIVARPGKRERVLVRGLGLPDVFDDPWFAKSYSWSPDGSRVAIARNGAIDVVAATGGEPQRITRPGKRAFAYAPVWSPDGKLIAYVRGRRILVVPARGGRSRLFTSFRLDSRCNPSDGCEDWVASLDWQARRR
jgi:hypothetical protein